MTRRRIFLSILLSIIGLTVWVVITRLSNTVEAWDSMYYYLIGLPIMCGASAFAGYLEPKSPHIWGILVLILQPVTLLFQTEIDSLLLAGIIFFMFFAVLTIGSAYLGAALRK